MSGDDAWSTGEPDEGGETDEDLDRIRGWVHPDDRLWRHPSEIGSSPRGPGRPGGGSVQPDTDSVLLAGGHLGRRGAAPWLICGSLCIAIVVAAVAVVVADTSEGSITATTTALPLRTPPTTEPGTSMSDETAELDARVSKVRPSTVALHVVRAGGSSDVMGVVAEAGGIVVTTGRAVSGETGITAVEPNGTRVAAAVLAVDPISDLAVVQIEDDLPAASFDPASPGAGSTAMAIALQPHPHAVPTPLVYAGTVVAAGTTVAGDRATATFASMAVRVPLGRSDLGSPLIDEGGNVAGLLDVTTGSGADQGAVFLPAELVAGVVRQLVSSGAVDQGWFGAEGWPTTETAAVSATEASVPSVPGLGALLTSVTKDGPAAQAGLAAGDLVQAVDGTPVHSMADLVTQLYPDPPGTTVAVTFERAQSSETVQVQLGDGDADRGHSPAP